MTCRWISRLVAAASLVAVLGGCGRSRPPATAGRKTIVATYSILGAAVRDLVGDAFTVTTAIPNGLDEPAANLDAGSRDTYRRHLRDLAAAGGAVIVATHDIDEAAEGDWTMLLAHRAVACGPSRDILTRPALLATLGMVGKYQEGGIVIVEREHGHD
jgi:hypothetical protein